MRLLHLFESTPRRVLLSFQNGKGQVFNESVSIGFRSINEDDDITYEYPESEGWIYIYSMELQHNGRSGRASEVLKYLTNWLDANDKTALLMPAASGKLSQDDLIAWYERNGFELEPSRHMIRYPK